MSTGVVVQILVDLIFLSAFAVTWLRISKPAKDDPRLSRGLQLLQSKIAVLEDLGDQTERQVQSISQLIEAKGREIQSQIAAADDQIRKIEAALGKSLEVANIFQDRIPHEEIIDRKATMKYVKAARLAHQGQSVDQIAEQVDLTRAEIEFVTKVNRNQLQFSEEDLPEWAKVTPEEEAKEPEEIKVAPTLIKPEIKSQGLSKLGDRFRQALELPQTQETPVLEVAPAVTAAKPVAKAPIGPAPAPVQEGPVIKKVVFPRVDEVQRKAIEKTLANRNLG